MFTRDERRAFLFLAAVTVAGAGARLVRPAAPDPPGATALLPPGDLARQLALAARAESLALPLAPGESVDVDRAAADELARLPRIGRELAHRIVADREAHGPFGSLAALDRVPGIGPGMLETLGPWVSFSGVPTPPLEAAGRPDGLAVDPAARRSVGEAAGNGERAAGRSASCPSGRLSLNSATATELACLPGIGPTLAARIVADRAARGPYREVQELERVAGIGKSTAQRLAPLLRAP